MTRAEAMRGLLEKVGEAERGEIVENAYLAMRRAHRGAAGQTITEWSSVDSFIVVETLSFLRALLSQQDTGEAG